MGLFDQLKDGVLGVFAGPQNPQAPQGAGQREALISAGLGTIASGNQDPWEAIAQGAMLGQQVGQQVQERQVALQQQAQLAAFVEEAGYDREGLTGLFMRTLAMGDIDTTKAIAEIIKSLPKPDTQTEVNRQSVSTVVSTAAGAPADVVQRLGEGAQVSVQRDPRTGQVFWESALPAQPESDLYSENFVEPNPDSPTGSYRIGIRRDSGVREVIGLGPPPAQASSGGVQGQINSNLATAMQNAEATLSTVDEHLANPVVSVLGGIARKGGIMGNIANGALAAVAPEGQLAMAAADQWTAATVRLLSGAQMTETERQGYRAAYLPAGNDTEEVQQQKAAARGALAALFGENPEGVTYEDTATILIEAGLGHTIPPKDQGSSSGLESARARLRGEI